MCESSEHRVIFLIKQYENMPENMFKAIANDWRVVQKHETNILSTGLVK